MTQNTSSAVMNKRVEPHDSLDFFPTPPWATRALTENLRRRHLIGKQCVWEPACGEGDMARTLAESFERVTATDVHDYGIGAPTRDFLIPEIDDHAPNWVITNPPFRLAASFALRALGVATSGVALLVRTAWLEGGVAKDGSGRYDTLFNPYPPTRILQFCDRVPMHKGTLTEKGSTSTAYCWVLWEDGFPGTRFGWIPRCRERLERRGDYDRAKERGPT